MQPLFLRPIAGRSLASIEAVRGRPAASRAAYAEVLQGAQLTQDSSLVMAIRLEQAASEYFALDAPVRASAVLAPLLNQPPPSGPRLRRHHARAEALAAAICSSCS